MKLDSRRMHPLRQRLNAEIHWLPYEPVALPAAAVFVLATDVDEREEAQWIESLAGAELHSASEIADGVQRFQGDGWRVLVQRHVETSRYLFLAEDRDHALGAAGPFGGALWQRLPADAIASVPGKVLTAARYAMLPAAELEPERWANMARRAFKRPIAGGLVGRSASAVFSDFVPDEDGFIRFLVVSRGESAEQNGRLLGRLLDVEAYRMLALLGLPAANRLLGELPRLEVEFQRLSTEIGGQRTTDEKALHDLLALGLKVEHHLSEQARRFSASRAYFELLQRRLDELDAQPIPGVPPLKAFLTRRLEGARDTIHDIGRWLEQLSSRIGAVGDLLRTRVSVRQETQNQQLLAALNRRFSLQLRLHQAAELLSVAIFTYYSAHLLADLAAFLGGLMHVEVDELTVRGISAPFLAAGAIWWLLRRRAHQTA